MRKVLAQNGLTENIHRVFDHRALVQPLRREVILGFDCGRVGVLLVALREPLAAPVIAEQRDGSIHPLQILARNPGRASEL